MKTSAHTMQLQQVQKVKVQYSSKQYVLNKGLGYY